MRESNEPFSEHDPLCTLIAQETVKALVMALRCLDKRKRKILLWRFGIMGEQKTLKEISDYYGITPARVRQLEQSGLARIRRNKRFEGYLPVSNAILDEVRNIDMSGEYTRVEKLWDCNHYARKKKKDGGEPL